MKIYVFIALRFSEDADEGDYEMLSNGMTTMDNYLWIKDGLLKSSSKGVVPKKSIWIGNTFFFRIKKKIKFMGKIATTNNLTPPTSAINSTIFYSTCDFFFS